MAYIYAKNSGHCWIIGPQESITYPFNLGNFREIRMGGFFSVVSSGTGNFNSIYNIDTGHTNCPQGTFYVGFKDSGNSLPGLGGSSFVGIGKKSTDSTCLITNVLPSASYLGFGVTNGAGNFTTIDTLGNTIFFNSQAQAGIQITTGNLDSNFASFWGISLGIINNVFTGMALFDSTNFYTDVSTGNLSRLINNPPNVSNFITGFFTTGNVNTTGFASFPIPQALYIYFPYLNNQLRIHALDVERFS